LIEKTSSDNEYIVNPLLAFAGREDKVFQTYAKIENQLRAIKGIKHTVTVPRALD